MMGPNDYLVMMAGWKQRQEHEELMQERQLHLLREILRTAINATSKAKIRYPSQIMQLQMDKHIEQKREENRKRMREVSDDLFARARQRGDLDENNQPVKNTG